MVLKTVHQNGKIILPFQSTIKNQMYFDACIF